jgi:hypothetical protein
MHRGVLKRNPLRHPIGVSTCIEYLVSCYIPKSRANNCASPPKNVTRYATVVTISIKRDKTIKVSKTRVTLAKTFQSFVMKPLDVLAPFGLFDGGDILYLLEKIRVPRLTLYSFGLIKVLG